MSLRGSSLSAPYNQKHRLFLGQFMKCNCLGLEEVISTLTARNYKQLSLTLSLQCNRVGVLLRTI